MLPSETVFACVSRVLITFKVKLKLLHLAHTLRALLHL